MSNVTRGLPAERFDRTSKLAQETAKLARKAAKLTKETASKPSRFEARVLDFGPLGMSELWLHSADGSKDKFFSLGAEDPQPRSAKEVFEEAEERPARQSDWGNAQFSDDDVMGG